MYVIVPAQAAATKWLESFREFPQLASFSLDEVMRKMTVSPARN